MFSENMQDDNKDVNPITDDGIIAEEAVMGDVDVQKEIKSDVPNGNLMVDVGDQQKNLSTERSDLPGAGEDEGQDKSVRNKKIICNEERIRRDRLKHYLLPPCNCKRKCIEQVPETNRRDIHRQFWTKSYNERSYFIHANSRQLSVKRRRKDAKGIRSRDSSFNYFFNVSGEEKMVCQKFFLNTLGFKSHKVLLTVASKSQGKVLPSPDKRCKSSPTNRLSDEERKNIQAHIMSYSPSCSHYRRVHAPNRVYISPQLSVAGMYRNYTQDGGKASYQTYRKEVTLKNISFAQLGQEECQVCIQYGEHNCSKQDETNCELCDLYEGHKARSIEARKLYQEDSSKENNEEEAFFSVDLEKVNMLPGMNEWGQNDSFYKADCGV